MLKLHTHSISYSSCETTYTCSSCPSSSSSGRRLPHYSWCSSSTSPFSECCPIRQYFFFLFFEFDVPLQSFRRIFMQLLESYLYVFFFFLHSLFECIDKPIGWERVCITSEISSAVSDKIFSSQDR